MIHTVEGLLAERDELARRNADQEQEIIRLRVLVARLERACGPICAPEEETGA